MKKYILNLINSDQNSVQAINTMGLGMFIGIYNHEQPNQDFINYLQNNLPYSFLFTEVGKETTTDGKPHTYRVMTYNGYEEVGTIEVINEEVKSPDQLLTKSMLLVWRTSKERGAKQRDHYIAFREGEYTYTDVKDAYEALLKKEEVYSASICEVKESTDY
jgi:hypothetical protein